MAALMVTVTAGAVGITAQPSQAATAPVAGGTYQLAVAKSGKCLEVPSGSADNGALMQQWTCTTAQWQKFTVVSSGSYVQLVNVNSGKCLDVPNASTTSGQQLWQWTCGSSTNQQWRFVSSGNGTYQVVSVSSGLCMTDKGASASDGAAVVQETCTANSDKQWAFTPAMGSSDTPTVASDGTGTYRTVQAAIDAVPAGNTARRVITIKPGTYREIVTIPSNKPYITLQGTGSSASSTVIVNNHYAGAYGTSGSATVFAYGHDFTATDLTISNDFDESSVTSGQQAVALHLNADRAVFSNVRLLGDQDTFLVNDATRAYMVDSYVEGTVDFVFGGGTIVFDRCSVHEKRSTGGTLTAASTAADKTYGFLFYKSTITGAASNNTSLGRPWRADAQVLYRESNLSGTIKTAQPWTDMSGNSWKNARFFEYRNTGSGATVNANRPQMSDSTAAAYTPQKYLAGSDGWNPVG
ncbi:pectinesterase family protein [Streptomyces shenzhenensis]|uniref:pectinesterase family protein n=1 Tax=Streptomyces shenzhenensis TaxID=943815 RepID=UPI001C691AA6|nr:pectinesterase family protein [Streptomyces shenzhenensis]